MDYVCPFTKDRCHDIQCPLWNTTTLKCSLNFNMDEFIDNLSKLITIIIYALSEDEEGDDSQDCLQ